MRPSYLAEPFPLASFAREPASHQRLQALVDGPQGDAGQVGAHLAVHVVGGGVGVGGVQKPEDGRALGGEALAAPLHRLSQDGVALLGLGQHRK